MSQSLDRALQILYDAVDGPLTVGQIARKLDVHHSTALRLLQTLQHRRFVFRLPDGRYRLGAGIIWVASRALEQLDLRALARPFLHELGDFTTETVHLAVLEGIQVIYIDKVENQHPVRMYSRTGAVAPLHCTGVAKAILAFSPPKLRTELLRDYQFQRFTPTTLMNTDDLETDFAISRERGYAIDNEEHELGIQWIAAPIMSAQEDVVAAISVSGPTGRLGSAQLLRYTPKLLEISSAISAELGHRHTSHTKAPPLG